jgi:hypothetical protein
MVMYSSDQQVFCTVYYVVIVHLDLEKKITETKMNRADLADDQLFRDVYVFIATLDLCRCSLYTISTLSSLYCLFTLASSVVPKSCLYSRIKSSWKMGSAKGARDEQLEGRSLKSNAIETSLEKQSADCSYEEQRYPKYSL